MKKIAASLVVCALLPLFLGAVGADAFTMGHPVPNPGGNAQQLQASGTWSLLATDTFNGITFQTTLKGTNQTTQATLTAAPGNANWTITLAVAAATYNPSQGTLNYTDGT